MFITSWCRPHHCSYLLLITTRTTQQPSNDASRLPEWNKRPRASCSVGFVMIMMIAATRSLYLPHSDPLPLLVPTHDDHQDPPTTFQRCQWNGTRGFCPHSIGFIMIVTHDPSTYPTHSDTPPTAHTHLRSPPGPPFDLQ